MTAFTMVMRRAGGTLGRLDRIVLAVIGIFALLTLAEPSQAQASLLFILDALLFIAPFLIVSVALAAGAKATGLDQQVARVFSGNQTSVIVMASVFGALSPFCSCGVVPLIAGFLAAGVPLAPVMAFWISSPIMDPEMFILTAAVLGPSLAIAKTVAALGMGLVAGFSTHFLIRQGVFPEPLKGVAVCGSSCGAPSLSESSDVTWAFWRDETRRALFQTEALRAGWFLFKWLTIAFVIESLMVAYIPAETVGRWMGGGWWAIPAAVVVGIPAYLNGYAAIPTVSGLMNLGMGPGAALSFMVAGAVTSIPAAMAVFALVRRAVFLWYLGLGLGGSLLAGLIYQGVAGSQVF